jgi:hypothetical protein
VVAHLVGALRYKPLGRGFNLFLPHFGSAVNSASNRNVLTTLPCADCLGFWEPQSPGAQKGLATPQIG